MISDDLLKQALADYDEDRLSRLPEESTCDHAFSPRFLQKMGRISTEKQRFYPRMNHMAASFSAVCLAGIMLFFCASPTARATVISWIRGQENTYYTYRSTNTSQSDDQLVYTLTAPPEAYQLFADHSDPGHGMVVYTSESGQLLTFQYTADNGSSAMYLDPESAVHSTVQIGDSIADVYIAQAETESSAIVWMDTKTNYLLTLTGFFTEEELIALAESVTLKT